MSEIKDGGPAFPYSALEPTERRGLVGTMYADNQGMSLRDWFAGMAIMGKADRQGLHPEQIKDAYAIADAMLKAREK